MIGNWFYRKGQALMHTEADFRIGIANVDWRKIKVTDDKLDLIGKHWSITGPTYARGRSITIEGYVIATTRAKTSMGMDWLDNLFALQWQLGNLELSEFKVIDEQNRERACQAKVDAPVDYDIEEDNDHNDWSLRRFRIVLFSPDPRFYSTTENTITGEEGNFGWFILNNDGFGIGNNGFPLSGVYNEITIIWNSNTDTPVKIELEVTGEINSPLVVYNVGNGSAFFLDITAVSGSVVVIDSTILKATLDGVDVTGQRLPWSSRPSVFGVTQLVIYDQEGWLSESDFNVTITYKDTLL